MGWLNTLEGNEDYAPDYAYPIVNGIQEITFLFERPETGVPIFIIVRPITKDAVALWNVRGFIWT